MRTFMTAIVLIVLALVGGGCGSSPNSVTEGDREVSHQTLGAAHAVRAALNSVRVVPGISDGLIDGALAAVHQIQLNAEHHAKVHGAAKEPKPFSVENAEAARKKSASEHAGGGGFWYWLAGAGLTLGGIAWTVVRQTVAGRAVDLLVSAGQKLKEKAAAGTLTADEVKSTLKDVVAAAPPAVQKKIEETLVRVKKKLPAELVTPAPAPMSTT